MNILPKLSARQTQILTASALIYDDRGERVKAFVARRSADRRFLPGVFELPGGHIHFGEHITAGLRRLIKERLHVEVEVCQPIFVFDYLNSQAGQHVVEVVYLAKLRDFRPHEITLTKAKHSESLWVSLENIETRLAEMKAYSPYEYKAVMNGLVFLEKQRQKSD